jgi:hypothetical protein
MQHPLIATDINLEVGNFLEYQMYYSVVLA